MFKSLSGRLTGGSGRACYQLKAFHAAAVNTPVNIYTQGLGDKQLESPNWWLMPVGKMPVGRQHSAVCASCHSPCRAPQHREIWLSTHLQPENWQIITAVSSASSQGSKCFSRMLFSARVIPDQNWENGFTLLCFRVELPSHFDGLKCGFNPVSSLDPWSAGEVFALMDPELLALLLHYVNCQSCNPGIDSFQKMFYMHVPR